MLPSLTNSFVRNEYAEHLCNPLPVATSYVVHTEDSNKGEKL